MHTLQSFFAWHVEDADLYSVNFLHWGAPKIWYCVPPSSKAKFERLAAGMHPEAYRACKGFLRHKDILISPSILKQFNVGYQMVCSPPCRSACRGWHESPKTLMVGISHAQCGKCVSCIMPKSRIVHESCHVSLAEAGHWERHRCCW